MDWFRFYSEVVRDPKVQKLSPTLFKHWINVLCLSNDNEPRGQVPMPNDVAYHLRISEGRAVVLLDELLALNLLDADDDGNLVPHNWSTRQYKSDTSTERVKKHRRNVSETPPDTETEQSRKQSRTEAEQIARAPAEMAVEFHPTTAPPWPDEPGLVGEWQREYETREGKHFTWAFDVHQLVKKYGEADVRALACSHGWIKHPNWLDPKLADLAKRANEPVAAGPSRKSDLYDE